MKNFKKITAMLLAVCMLAPTVFVPAVRAHASETAGEQGVSTSEFLAENLKDSKAEKASGKSEDYWEKEAPADADEAAAMYAEDAYDADTEAGNGAGKADLDKMDVERAEKKYDGNGMRETMHYVRVTYTIANRKYLKAKTLDGLFHGNIDAFLASTVSIAPVYEVKGYDDCYVSFLNYGGLNGLSDQIIDYEFVTNVQTSPKDVKDDVVFDKKTGIVYIPKSYYFAADGTELGYDLQGQLLIAPDLESDVEVNVSVENRSPAKTLLQDGRMAFTTFNTMTFQLVDKADAGKISLDDIRVYVNDSALALDLENGGGSYNAKTGEFTLNNIAAATYSVRFVIGGKTLAQKALEVLGFRTEARAAVTGSTMTCVKNVDTGKEIAPSIEVDKLKVGDVYEYDGRNSTHNYDAYRAMLDAGQKNFIYGPRLPTGTTSSVRSKFYEYLTTEEDEGGAKSLSKIIDGLGGLVAAKDQTENGDHNWKYWYMFAVGAPSGTLTEIHDSSREVKFGSASEWKWSDTFEHEGETRWRNMYTAMCCHVGDDLIDSDKKNQVSVLEKGDGYVVLGLTQTAEGATTADGAQAGACIIKVRLAGEVKLKKVSSNPALTDGNNCYSLAGAQYGVYSDAGCTVLVGTLTTVADGSTNTLELPAGNYYIKETVASKGYLLDKNIYPVTVEAGKELSKEVQEEPGDDPINIDLDKLDSVTGAHAQGGASLAGAEFTIKYYDGWYYTKANLPKDAKRTWVIKTVEQENGIYRANLDLPECKVHGDDYYYDADGKITIPLGTVTIQETKAPEGYLLEGAVLTNKTTGETVKDGGLYVTQVVQDANGDEARFVGGGELNAGNRADSVTFEIKEVVKRGDISLRKIDSDTQKCIAGVQFRLTQEKTGESHTFTVDSNGEYSTESTFVKHSQGTNGGNDGDGIWFARSQANGPEAPVDDTLGALPYGKYTLEEIESDVNKGKVMHKSTFEVGKDGYTVPLGNVENRNKPELSTEALDAESGTHTGTGRTLKDTVSYAGFTQDTEYLLKAQLIDKETGEAAAEGTTKFTATKASDKAVVEVTLPEDYGTDGKTFVFYEELYFVNKDGEPDGTPIAEHKDISDESQSIYYPEIGTEAADGLTKGHVGAAGETAVVDTVSYTNLVPGQEYTIKGVLMDKATGEPLQAEVPEEDKGLLDKFKDTIAGIVDSAVDFITGGSDDGEDEDKDSKEDQADYGSYVYEASVTFVPKEPDGTVELTYELDASIFQGKTAVVFEELYVKGEIAAEHKDIDDEDQTVYYPGVETTAVDTATQEHVTQHSETATITDRVEYTNLISGNTYKVVGILMDQSTGEPLLDNDGKEHISTVTFIAGEQPGYETLAADDGTEYYHVFAGVDGNYYFKPDGEGGYVSCNEYGADVENLVAAEESQVMPGSSAEAGKTVSGSVDLVYTVDTTLLSGKTTVVFEELYYNDIKIASHADITDESQSVYTPKITTTATVDGEHEAPPSEDTTIVDTVVYENLVPGLEYTLTGTLMDKATGDIIASETEPVTFTPEAPSGSVDITFHVDTSDISSGTVVAFEELMLGTTLVAEHKDIDDEDQSVLFDDSLVDDEDNEDGDKGKDDEDGLVDNVQTGDYILGIVLLLAGGGAAGLIGWKLRKKGPKGPYVM